MTDDERFSLLGRRLGPAFDVRVIAVPAGGTRRGSAADWRGALVSVEAGAIEVDCAGGRRRFGQGAVLCLDGLGVRSVRNVGPGVALLVAVSRKRSPGQV